jgi:hypothetical protein
MNNCRVAHFPAILPRSLPADMSEGGVTVDDRIEGSEYGRIGLSMDPAGHCIESREPPSTSE